MRWAELVFHVLAHVRVSAPASAYDEEWIRFVERAAGPAQQRPLGEDAVAIASTASSHDALAAVQLIAWLWNDSARAAACSERTLDELTDTDVDDPSVLRVVRRHSVAAEILRAAAELETDVVASLPPLTAIEPTPRLAPWVEGFAIAHLRPLRLRGRVYRDEILVGLPNREIGPSAEHVAWQIAHEATVSRLHRAAAQKDLSATYELVESAAIAALREHAARTGQSESHATWLAHFARVPNASLPDAWRALVQSMMAR